MFENNIYTYENASSVQNFTISKTESEASPHGGSKKPRTKLPALALVTCVAASGLFGFAGGYVSNQVQEALPASVSDTASASQTEVLYQSVIRTAASSDSSANERQV